MSREQPETVSREALWIAIGQVAGVTGALLGVRVLTTYMSPSGYGQLALATTVALLAQQCLHGPVSNAALRFYPVAAANHELPDLARAVWVSTRHVSRVLLALVVPAVLVGALVHNFELSLLAVLAGSYALLLGPSVVIDGSMTGARHRRVVAWQQGAGQWLRWLLPLPLLMAGATEAAIVLAGYSLATAGLLWVRWGSLKRYLPAAVAGIPVERDSPWGERVQEFARPFRIFGVVTWVKLASERWSLEFLASTPEVGLYAVLNQLGVYPVTLLYSFTTQLAAPLLFWQAGSSVGQHQLTSAFRRLDWLVGTSLVATAGLTGLAYLFGPTAAGILVGPEFNRVGTLLWLAVLGAGLFAAGELTCLAHHLNQQPARMTSMKVTTSLAGVGFNLIGAHLAGAEGVAYASVIFGVLYLGWAVALQTTIRTVGA